MARVRSQEVLQVGLGPGALSRTLESVTLDLAFIAHHRLLKMAVDSPTAINLRNLAVDFATFSVTKGIYEQLRWIDETGMEVVRVDYVNGKPIMASDKLQDKNNRYAYTDTIQLNPGEIFVSPLDMNIEHNKLEVPYKPIVGVATPIADSRGNRRGIVIVNF